MKALLLIGGQATRLSPLNKHIAKSLMPLVDREVLNYQVGQLARAGVVVAGSALLFGLGALATRSRRRG